VLITGIGVAGCFALSALSYLPFIAVALWILPRRGASHPAAAPFDRHHPLAGVGAILRQPGLRGALATVIATSTLCGPLLTFVPVLVKDALHADVSRFSISVGAFGVGGLAGAVALLAFSKGRDLRRISSRFAAAYGVVVVLAALDPVFWGLPPLLVLAGAAMNVANTAANSYLQEVADPLLRGQTVSLYMLAQRGGLSVGSLATGALVSALNVREALLINGLIALAAHLLIGRAWLRPEAPAATAP
jgi:predicted MFS family arabinose efflux permease